MNVNRIISITTGVLTVALAGAAFTLSFNSLTELAAGQGLSVPVLFPLILEGGLIVFSLTALTRSLQGQSARLQWMLVITSSFTAMGFNILHAPDNWAARVMWGIPSVMLLLAFESFLSQVRYGVNRSESVDNLGKLTGQIAARRAELARVEAKVRAAQQVTERTFIPGDRDALDKANATRQDIIEERRAKVLTRLNEGMSAPAIAQEMGVSLGTIKSDKKALNGKVIG